MYTIEIPDPQHQPWLPSLDVHAEEGELVLHADLSDLLAEEDVAIALDGPDLILQGRADSAHRSRLHLPFVPEELRAVGRVHEMLEVRVLLPEP